MGTPARDNMTLHFPILPPNTQECQTQEAHFPVVFEHKLAKFGLQNAATAYVKIPPPLEESIEILKILENATTTETKVQDSSTQMPTTIHQWKTAAKKGKRAAVAVAGPTWEGTATAKCKEAETTLISCMGGGVRWGMLGSC